MTRHELVKLWQDRDRRYAVRRHHGRTAPLMPAEQDSIRAWRLHEISLLPSDDRPAALAVLSAWRAPVVNDF
jgi:hypothetical protein